MKLKTVYKPGSFITFVDNKATTFTKDNPFFDRIVELYKEKKWDEIKDYFNLKNYVFKYSNGRIKVGDEVVLYDNKEVHNEIATRILQFLKEGIDIAPLCLFLENLWNNPEEHVRQDLFLFLENNQLPITDDGGFVAYKLVKNDYSPYYMSGMKERYHVGFDVTYPREQCYNGRTECGGGGLYFARKEYWSSVSFDEQNRYSGDGRMLIVKIMPQDVTSVPAGEGGRKGICCKMYVLNEYESVKQKVVDKAVFSVRPEAQDIINKVSEVLEDDIEDCIISAPVSIKKQSRKIMRDSKGHFLSKKSIVAKMPKRDKSGRFLAKKARR
jgi:hypothetical protein